MALPLKPCQASLIASSWSLPLQVRKQMLAELTRVGKEAKLKGFEMIKAVHIESEPFR